jgi:hypothetical protein
MRFRNSSDYFGLADSTKKANELDSATGKGFHVIADQASAAMTTPIPRARCFPTANSAVASHSKVTSTIFETQSRQVTSAQAHSQKIENL